MFILRQGESLNTVSDREKKNKDLIQVRMRTWTEMFSWRLIGQKLLSTDTGRLKKKKKLAFKKAEKPTFKISCLWS